jgi:hypothetical protein
MAPPSPAGPPTSTGPSERYRRHLVLREVGPTGQARIQLGAVSVVGTGPGAEEAAFYLVAAGVGRVVLEGPLFSRIGERLSELNPEVVLADAALLPLEVRPEDGERRADGAKAALMALLLLSGASEATSWREDPR